MFNIGFQIDRVLTMDIVLVSLLANLGGNTGEATPGPIPNPEVKLSEADDTAPVRGWESR